MSDADMAALHDLASWRPAGDRTVTVHLTQDELAMLSGCSRPTVNRALAGAARAGLLTSGRASITVVDVARLRAHAHA